MVFVPVFFVLLAKKGNTCPPPEEKGEAGFKEKFEVPKGLKV